MAFDWLSLLDSNQIDYRSTGRDQVSINCPFCMDDPSKHMSINLEGHGWRCWRQPEDHYGRNPNRLVAALLRIPVAQAAQITGSNTFVPANFMDRVQRAMQPPERIPPKSPKLPAEFKVLDSKISARPYSNYLLDRGFSLDEIYRFHKYGIYYAPRGAYHGRIIFTINKDKKLATWTGRTVSKTETLRYRTLSHDPEKAAKEGMSPALGPITDYLLWYDELMRVDADTLVMCEGPFDALKVRRLGRKDGIVGSCFFTSRVTLEQLALLETLSSRFKRRYLILDRNTLPLALRIQGHLRNFSAKLIELPDDKDPGELVSTRHLKKLLDA